MELHTPKMPLDFRYVNYYQLGCFSNSFTNQSIVHIDTICVYIYIYRYCFSKFIHVFTPFSSKFVPTISPQKRLGHPTQSDHQAVVHHLMEHVRSRSRRPLQMLAEATAAARSAGHSTDALAALAVRMGGEQMNGGKVRWACFFFWGGGVVIRSNGLIDSFGLKLRHKVLPMQICNFI